MADPGDVQRLLELIRNRISVEKFDPTHFLDDAEIRELVADAIQAPSSFNIQHWRFVAVRRPEDKARLQEAAYGQQQVADAAVTFIILGDVEGVEKLPAAMDQAVAEGALPRPRADAWVGMARQIYGNPQMARDEAVRSCSLAAMTLMLAAEARGLCAGALTGFDSRKVALDFDIEERYVPVMLLAVGRSASSDERRKPRFPVDEVLAFDRSRRF